MSDPTSLNSEWIPEDRSGAQPGDGSIEGRTLGDFELLGTIGRGGMGVVYEARQLSLQRRVALKVLPPGLGLSPQAIKRFEREAHAAARLHHTNIVPVHAIGREGDYHFYAMELVEGQPLDRILSNLSGPHPNRPTDGTDDRTTAGTVQQTRLAPDETTTSLSDTSAGRRDWFDRVAGLVADVAEALHYAHGRGVIHRDVKPANLILSTDGRLMLTDFGLARLAEQPGLTVSGSFMGTPAYMSPEQIAAGRMKLDHRTDIYSLGVVLYELMTLRRPFEEQSREEIIAAIMTKEPRPPRRFNHRIPVDLETICLKSIEKDPDRRYQTSGELARDLRRFLQRGLISARRAGWLRRSAKAVRRHPLATTITLSLVVLAIALGGFAWSTSRIKTREAVQKAVSSAKEHLIAGLYREGLEEVNRALNLAPDSPGARLVRARLLMKLGRAREAVLEANALLLRDRNDWTAHLILASAAQSLPWIPVEDHNRVIQELAPASADAFYLRSLVSEVSRVKLEHLNRALELNPGHVEALLDRIRLRTSELKDHTAALRDCDLLVAIRRRSAEGRRMRARVYSDQQDFEAALVEIARAIELDPEDAMNFEARGSVFESLGRHDEAIADFSRAIDLDPGHAQFYEHRANAYNQDGKFAQAVADARQALQINPDWRFAYHPLFHAYRRLGRVADLRAALDSLSAEADGWSDRHARAWAYRGIAGHLRDLKDYERALEAANRAIANDPLRFSGYTTRARIRRLAGDEAGFGSDCDAAASVEVMDPDDLSARGHDLGWYCARWDLSLKDHDRLVAEYPNWHVAHFDRGTTLAHLEGREEDALDAHARATELAPKWSQPYVNRAVILGRLNLIEEMLVNVNKAIELDSNLGPELYANRGFAYYRVGLLDRALDDADKAIELDPLYGPAYVLRGVVLAASGECNTTAELLRDAKQQNPTSPWVQNAVAWAHVNVLVYDCPEQFDAVVALGEIEKAFQYFAGPNSRTLGQALYRNGRYQEARRALLDSFERSRGNGAWFVLAMSTWRLGERDEARRYYDDSVSWMAEHGLSGPMYAQQKAEAAGLLGLSR